MGDDTLYSGTVAAASEGYLFGIPRSPSRSPRGLGASNRRPAPLARWSNAIWCSRWRRVLLNVNIPNRRFEDLHGFQVTRLGKRHPSQPVVHHHALWRHGLLDRSGRLGGRRGAGHGFPCRGAGPGLGHAAAAGPDAAQPAGRDPRLGGAAMRKRVSQPDVSQPVPGRPRPLGYGSDWRRHARQQQHAHLRRRARRHQAPVPSSGGNLGLNSDRLRQAMVQRLRARGIRRRACCSTPWPPCPICSWTRPWRAAPTSRRCPSAIHRPFPSPGWWRA